MAKTDGLTGKRIIIYNVICCCRVLPSELMEENPLNCEQFFPVNQQISTAFMLDHLDYCRLIIYTLSKK